MNVILSMFILLLLFLLQRRIYRRYWDRGLIVLLSFSQANAREGQALTLHESISNRKKLPLPVFHVKFAVSRHLAFEDNDNSQISDLYYRNDIFSVMMNQKITRNLNFLCSRRGYYTISQIDTVCSDIFMSARIVNILPCRLQLYVYPKLIYGGEYDILFQTLFGTVLTKRLVNEDPFEFRGIREYQPYDSLKSVNFKASAKTGEWKVNEHAPTSSRQVRLLLNLESESIWRYDDLLEESVRLADTLALSFLAQGIPVSLCSNGADLLTEQPVSIEAGSGSSHQKMIDEALAGIDTLEVSVSFASLLEQILENGTQDILILISTSRIRELTEAVRQLHQNAVSIFWLVPLHSDMENIIPDGLEHVMLRWNTAGQS